MTDEEFDTQNLIAWDMAEFIAKTEGDTSQIVRLLREFHHFSESNVPNLSFLADLIEGKFKKSHGRPRVNNIILGYKNRRVAETVAFFISENELTQEEAFEKTSKIVHMSESSVKKIYIKLKDENLIENSLFREKILRSIK